MCDRIYALLLKGLVGHLIEAFSQLEPGLLLKQVLAKVPELLLQIIILSDLCPRVQLHEESSQFQILFGAKREATTHTLCKVHIVEF